MAYMRRLEHSKTSGAIRSGAEDVAFQQSVCSNQNYARATSQIDAGGVEKNVKEFVHGGLRMGVMEKASQSTDTWKPRRVTLLPDGLWYSKEDNSWTCIALSEITRLEEMPEDRRALVLSTRHRAYKFRAANASDRDMWLLIIAKHASLFKERSELRRVERSIVRAELTRSSRELAFLEECRSLEGTLMFTATRDLLIDFIDYIRVRYPDELKLPTGTVDVQAVVVALGLCNSEAQLPNESQQNCEGTGGARSVEAQQSEENSVYNWLRSTIFPLYLENQTFQKRVAQLVASRFARHLQHREA